MKDCEHKPELCKRQIADGRWIAGEQCLRCGRWAGKKNPPDLMALPEFDPEIRERAETVEREYYARVFEQRLAEQKRQEEARNRAWWTDYDAYLLTPEWQRRRALTIRRAAGVCEAMVVCNGARATQAHHLTYRHLGNEPIFDLRAVCHACHEQITAQDRAARAPVNGLTTPGAHGANGAQR